MSDDQLSPPLAMANLISGSKLAVSLLLGWRTKAPDYNIEVIECESSVSDIFLEYAKAEVARLINKERIDYEPEWILRDSEYFELRRNEFPGSNLFGQLQTFTTRKTFKRKNLTKPQLYIVAVQVGGSVVFFGRGMAKLQVLKQTKGKFSLVWDGSTFNALSDSIATFSDDFDWILWNDYIFIINDAGFHRLFRDDPALMKAVSDHVTKICERLNIVNGDDFVKRCQSNVAMASKLRRVSEKGLQLTHSIEELKQYASDWNIAVQWQDDSLVFEESLASQWNILKLLDEDRTEGPLSHRHYESAAKREVS